MNFEVKFIDYGSTTSLRDTIKQLVESYEFCQYQYTYTRYQPWNKSRALNIVIKEIEADYCFVADVDMLFSPDFISSLHALKHPEQVTYFQVGFLSKEMSEEELPFASYTPKFLSTHEATGLSLFPVKKLKELRGFDEFFHFWGAEDTEIHNRLKGFGVDVNFYDASVLLLHQWHENFHSKSKRPFYEFLSISNIQKINKQHLESNLKQGVKIANEDAWGNSIDASEFDELHSQEVNYKLTNSKLEIEQLLKVILPENTGSKVGVEIVKQKNTWIQKLLNKRSGILKMNQINDLLLLEVITNYRNKNYIYKVADSGTKITLKIKL